MEGGNDKPVLMLSNSLGSNLSMWDDQADEFAKHFRLIRYDRRGHGRSGVPQGPYSMERFGRDVLAVLDTLRSKRPTGAACPWAACGQARRPCAERVEKLVLSNTHSHYPDKGPWAERIEAVRDQGLENLVEGNMQRCFTAPSRERAPETIERMKAMSSPRTRPAISAAARPSATWICARATRASPRRPW